jgi:hypothetical protein
MIKTAGPSLRTAWGRAQESSPAPSANERIPHFGAISSDFLILILILILIFCTRALFRNGSVTGGWSG